MVAAPVTAWPNVYTFGYWVPLPQQRDQNDWPRNCIRAVRGRKSDQKLPLRHDPFVVEPDVEEAADAVDVRGALPRLARVLGIGVAEGDVDAGKLFVLQDVADDAGAGEVGADGEFADAVGVFVGMAI